MDRYKMALVFPLLLCAISVATPAERPVVPGHRSAGGTTGLNVQNGWYVHNGEVVWGFCQHNGWWREGQRPNLARNAPGEIGPNRTEDLERLTDAMLRFGYPGFEHNFGLWFDRRRDSHLVYTSSGNRFQLDLSRVSGEFQVQWLNPRTGKVAGANRAAAGNHAEFTPPNSSDWALHLQRRPQ